MPFYLTKRKTPWSLSASELYRPRDRSLSAKLVSTFADRECHVVSMTYPYGRILGFLDRTFYLTTILILANHVLPIGLFPSAFPTVILYAFLFPIRATYPANPIILLAPVNLLLTEDALGAQFLQLAELIVRVEHSHAADCCHHNHVCSAVVLRRKHGQSLRMEGTWALWGLPLSGACTDCPLTLFLQNMSGETSTRQYGAMYRTTEHSQTLL
jgi:hypothetical protein